MHKGCVVCEIFCAHRPITNPDALKTCGTFESKLRVPSLNEHVQVTGTYVLDNEPGHGWFALNPVSDVVLLPKRN